MPTGEHNEDRWSSARRRASAAADQFERDLADALERQLQEFERELREGLPASLVDFPRVHISEDLHAELCARIVGALEGKVRDKAKGAGERAGRKSVGTPAQREAFARAVADALPELVSFDWDGTRAHDVREQCQKANDCLWETLRTLYVATQSSREFRATPEVSASMQAILLLRKPLSALEGILLTREYASPGRSGSRGEDKGPGVARATRLGLLYLEHLGTAPTDGPFGRVCKAIMDVVGANAFHLPRDAQRLAIQRLRGRALDGEVPRDRPVLETFSRNWDLLVPKDS